MVSDTSLVSQCGWPVNMGRKRVSSGGETERRGGGSSVDSGVRRPEKKWRRKWRRKWRLATGGLHATMEEGTPDF
ncbi:hypothetical protein HAX54_003372 [Datura stramonium]|uniref:Uncharacterized protein n=1 Tax=Datura stramonium TaxID=4076 RepID=A0ABS8T605_DATST|nr:hypothetical protein [Datura stramonium]